MERQIINPWNWQDEQGWSWAIAVSGGQRTLYCAGQVSMDADGRVVHIGDMPAQINQALDNLETVLSKAGFNLSDVVRIDYYTTDTDRLLANWDIIKNRLVTAGCRAGGVLLGVSRLAFPELLIEIEATAVQ